MFRIFYFIIATYIIISNEIFSLQFNPVNSFNIPVIAYKVDSLWHFVNAEGKDIFGPIPLEEVGGYSEGFIRAKIKIDDKSRWVFFNLKGEIEIAPKCHLISDFRDGMARTIFIKDIEKEDMLFGFINRSGKQVVPIIYKDAVGFSEGRAYIMNDEQRGYIDTSGKFILKMQDIVGYDFSEGLAAVSNAQFRVGFIDTTGKLVINYMFDEPSNFSEGKAKVTQDGNFGFINSKGEVVIPLKFDEARDFHEGRSFVAKMNNKHLYNYALIDSTGKLLTDYIFKYAYDFSEGVAAVKVDSLWGFIDKVGNYVFKPQFSYADSFIDGMAYISKKSEGKYGYINHASEFIFTIPKAEQAMDLRFNRYVY